MTDLDSTQIINADESLLQNASTIETEASLTIVSGAEANTYPITKETIIGRASPSDLIIPAVSLSKQHAKITYTNGQYFITDLGSSNKTFHNKVQLQANVCYALHDGDEVKFGDLICSFHEQKSNKTKDTLSEPEAFESYVPVANTLVEEDSPWDIDNDVVEPLPSIVEETKDEAIPSTQTISDSYDDEEPTQPMKIWNGNGNNISRLSRTSAKSSEDNLSKTNGVTESKSNGSSSFIPSTSTSSTVPNDDQDDGSLVIGSSTLPATVPLVIESPQIKNDDQLEIVSSMPTKKAPVEETEEEEVEEPNVENDAITIETKTITTTEIEIANTQAYTLEPPGEINVSDNQIAETQPYELQSEPIVTDVVETKQEEIHKVVIEGDTLLKEITTVTTTTTTTIAVVENENLPSETLAYDLQPTHESVQIETTTTTVCMDTQAYDLDEQVKNAPEITKDTGDAVENEVASEPIETVAEQDTQVNEDMETEQTNTLAATEEQPTKADSAEPTPSTADKTDDALVSSTNAEEMTIDESEAPTTETPSTATEPEKVSNFDQSATVSSSEAEMKDSEPTNSTKIEETAASSKPETEESHPAEEAEADVGEEEEEEEGKEGAEESVPTTGRPRRGVPRRNARRARGRRGGAAARARVVSTRIYGARRNAIAPTPTEAESNNTTLEETIQTETEESPKKSTVAKPKAAEEKPKSPDTQPVESVSEAPTNESSAINQNNSGSNVRVSARIKARASSGRNRQFPYADDYVDLDDLEKQTKAASATTSSATTMRKSNRGGRSSSTPQKRISLRQQPAETVESPEETTGKQKEQADVYEDMDTGGENEEPFATTNTRTIGRKRKSTTPVSSTASKRTRSTTPQTAPTISTRRKQTAEIEEAPVISSTTPKRGRKSTKSETPNNPPVAAAASSTPAEDRPVRIALSSHLNFDQNHLETLRKLGFEMMDESCHVDALVVDRIRRTKKFFMCLARGAHILSPTWIETMIKENRYVPYDKFYLQDTAAETKYGFELRESVRLAKQHPIFENYKVFCTKDTSPPYDDLKDIVEAAGGKFIEKINMSKPGKDLICIVAQSHKHEYEDLFKKGVPIVSEEFALSGISKQKLDFTSFSLFQNVANTVKTTGTK